MIVCRYCSSAEVRGGGQKVSVIAGRRANRARSPAERVWLQGRGRRRFRLALDLRSEPGDRRPRAVDVVERRTRRLCGVRRRRRRRQVRRPASRAPSARAASRADGTYARRGRDSLEGAHRGGGLKVPKCIKWGEERHQECSDYRDEGYNACSEYRSRCCDWWPCSWACEVVSWFCYAWYWVSNVVCVAWTWVTTAVCVAWDAVTTVVGAVVETVDSILSWVGSAAAFLVELVFAIPYVGRLLKWIWNGIL